MVLDQVRAFDDRTAKREEFSKTLPRFAHPCLRLLRLSQQIFAHDVARRGRRDDLRHLGTSSRSPLFRYGADRLRLATFVRRTALPSSG